jgi:hypothetical protein
LAQIQAAGPKTDSNEEDPGVENSESPPDLPEGESLGVDIGDEGTVEV